jgi:ABC-type antimicrobial peptide transport system permease subunit
MNRVLMTVAILISLCGVPILAAAPNTNQLQPETVKAWDEYVRTVDSRFGVRSSGGVPFLWIDESNQRAGASDREKFS